ncbi:hypothetical protein GQ53DRAFT_125227 [Thozetella sp. PMI_491]|nr:hypothetical protein GQ53DRAFT_125227 [Thozetella sp. PMI_491]
MVAGSWVCVNGGAPVLSVALASYWTAALGFYFYSFRFVFLSERNLDGSRLSLVVTTRRRMQSFFFFSVPSCRAHLHFPWVWLAALNRRACSIVNLDEGSAPFPGYARSSRRAAGQQWRRKANHEQGLQEPETGNSAASRFASHEWLTPPAGPRPGGLPLGRRRTPELSLCSAVPTLAHQRHG